MPTEPKVVAIIPARWDSSRFPGKPLQTIQGKPMIQWVFERVNKAKRVSEVLVATDDLRIMETVKHFGGKAVMTSKDHASGTDRIAEVAADIPCEIVINVQGDEPLIPPNNIDLIVEPFLADSLLRVSTLKMRLEHPEEIRNPNITKVVTDRNGYALYFSRAPIPFDRDHWKKLFFGGNIDSKTVQNVPVFKHIGIYGFTKSFLMEYSKWPRTVLEEVEKLEQLRILENGVPVKVIETRDSSIGVDCVDDLIQVERILSAG